MKVRCRAVIAVVNAAAAVALAVVSFAVDAQDPARYPLMSVEQHRASVVKAIVDRWSTAFAVLPGSEQRTAEQLGNELWTLRSDRLLAASLAGTYITVADLLNQSRSEKAGGPDKPAAKALGDAAADLTFTPLTPCRLVDTRVAGGALSASVNRTLNGFSATTFASQGGAASNCGIPNNVASLALSIAAVQPAAPGFITLWQANVPRPVTGSTINYAAEAFATATGAIVPVNGSSNQFTAWSPATVDLVVDVVGYFRAPAATALDCVETASSSATVAAGQLGSTISPACNTGYSLVSGNCHTALTATLKWMGRYPSDATKWWCVAYATAAGGSDSVVASGNCCRVPGH